VPVALSLPRCRQPVTLTERDELCVLREVCELGVCDAGGFCALTAATTPNATAAQVPDQIRTSIVPPWRFAISPATAVQLLDQTQRGRRWFGTNGIRRGWRHSAKGMSGNDASIAP
jgi:hypothetical protein